MPLNYLEAETVDQIMNLYSSWETEEREKRATLIKIEVMRRPDMPAHMAEMRFGLQVSNLQLIQASMTVPGRSQITGDEYMEIVPGWILYWLHN
jgi:hypothetical protein